MVLDHQNFQVGQCFQRILLLPVKDSRSRILDKLIRRGWQRLDQPVRLSKPAKLWIALRYGLF